MSRTIKFIIIILLCGSYNQLFSNVADSVKLIRIVNAKLEKKKQYTRLTKAKINNDKLEITKSYFSLGASYQVLGYYDSSQTYFDSALKIIKRNNNKPYNLLIEALKRSGDNSMFQGEYDDALTNYNSIIQLEGIGSKSEYIGKAYKGISSVYQNIGNYSEALEFGLKALEIATENENKPELAKVSNEIGIIYKRLEYYEKAILFFNKSIKIKKELNDEIGLTSSYLNIGTIYSRQENYGLAIEHFKKSLELKNKLSIVKGVAAVYANIGLVYKRKKEYDSAENYYYKALNEARNTKSKSYEFVALNNLTSLYLEINKSEQAKKYGRLALKVAKITGSKKSLVLANYNLYEAYMYTGNHKEALQYYVEYNKNDDSISTKRTVAKIERLERELLIKEKDKELVLKNKELELSDIKQDLSRTRNAIIIIALIMAISLLVLLLYFKNKQNKMRLSVLATEKNTLQLAHEQIEQKLRYEKLSKEHYLTQLENQELQTTTKNLEVGKLEKDLEKLKNQLVSSKTKESKSLAETIVLLGKSEKDWALFMNYFQEVYHDFHKNLITDYPNLTPHELRLCALLKINLSTKEIADILNISPASLRTSKYRLRKKLSLEEDMNVQEFILKY